MTKWMRRALPVGVAVLLAFGFRPGAAQDEDPGAEGGATPEEIAKSNGVSSADTSTASQAAEEGRGASARPENGARSAPGVLTPADDDLRAVPNGVTVHVTRGDTNVRLEGTLWLALPRPCARDTTDTAHVACVAAARGRTSRVTVRALDLVSSEHGDRIRGGRGDIATLTGSGAPVPWSATVPLGDARAGTYHGFLLFTRESDATLTARPPVEVPVVVYVRDPFGWTLLLLGFAIPLFFLLRWYRDSRLKEHTSYVRIADAEALILSDPHIADAQGVAVPFRERFASLLRAAAALVENPATDHGPEQPLKAAEELWVTWQAGHPNWLTGLGIDRAQIQALTRQVNARAVAGQARSPHLDGLLAGAKAAYESAPDVAAESSGEAEASAVQGDAGAKAALRYRREAAARVLKGERYTSLLKALADRRAKVPELPETGRKARLKDIDDAQARWEQADPDAKETAALAVKLIAGLDGTPAGRDLPAEEPDGDDSVSSDDPGAESGFVRDTESELVPRRFAARIDTARKARRTYAVVVGILVFTATLLLGLRETWGSDPSFGDDWLEDYLEVLLWIMGANVASLATIAAIAGQWSLPWLGKVAGAVAAGGRASGPAAEAMGPAGSGSRPLRRF